MKGGNNKCQQWARVYRGDHFALSSSASSRALDGPPPLARSHSGWDHRASSPALHPLCPRPSIASPNPTLSNPPSPPPTQPSIKLSRKERTRASTTLTTFATHLRLTFLNTSTESHQYRPRSMYFPTFLLNRVLDNLFNIMCVEDLSTMCGTREWAFQERWEGELWVVVRATQEDVRKGRAEEHDGEAHVDPPAPEPIDVAETPMPSARHSHSRVPTQERGIALRTLPCAVSAHVPPSPLPSSLSTPSIHPAPSHPSPPSPQPKLSRTERARASKILTTFAARLRLASLPLETHQYRPRSMYFPTFLLNRVLDNLLDIMCVEDLGKMCGTREWAFKERWEGELWVVVRGLREGVSKEGS
ncbi:hypothetical protein PLICRDRAFT_169253 [Plicaturopsis crispa FD-325 SS-3]|nr:hypothetical protein PLICRDRAFT_169253 [Plicaturopsis crispa FD-325 SS-3]